MISSVSPAGIGSGHVPLFRLDRLRCDLVQQFLAANRCRLRRWCRRLILGPVRIEQIAQLFR